MKSLRAAGMAFALTVAALATGLGTAQPSSATTPNPLTRTILLADKSTGSATLPYGAPALVALDEGSYYWEQDFNQMQQKTRRLTLAKGSYYWQCKIQGTGSLFQYFGYCTLTSTSTGVSAWLPYSGTDEFALSGTYTWRSTLTSD